jgi:hypothetical protein
MKTLTALLFILACTLRASDDSSAFQPRPLSLSAEKPKITLPAFPIPQNPLPSLLGILPGQHPWKLEYSYNDTSLTFSNNIKLQPVPEQPALHVRRVTTAAGNAWPDRIYYEYSVSSNQETPEYLWINAVTGLRRLPYDTGDTYFGPSSQEQTVAQPKAAVRIKVNGDWQDIPVSREPGSPDAAGIMRLPTFQSLPVNEEIKLGGFWLPRDKKLEAIEIDLTQLIEPGKGRIQTLSWVSQ